jgi:nicotinic acid mononucleotide adenylyltransferase
VDPKGIPDLTRSSAAAAAVDQIRRSAGEQFLEMERWATDPSCLDSLHSISAYLIERLKIISDLAKSGSIRIFRHVVLEERDEPVPVEERPLRLGIYPLAANPMHWGHILVGLSAMAWLRLDKVVFIVAGTDSRKPSMTSAETRHRLSQSAIETFRPLFEYSPLALHTGLDGETNCGRLLTLNMRQPLDAFYIAGWDHYRRTTPQGEDDTVAKLEKLVAAGMADSSSRHKLSAVFVARDGAFPEQEEVHTSLSIHLLPPVPFSFSSTSARQALCYDADCMALVSVPYSCLLEIKRDELYASKSDCAGDNESVVAPKRVLAVDLDPDNNQVGPMVGIV